MKTLVCLVAAAALLASCASYDPAVPGTRAPKPFHRGECQVKARDGLWHDCVTVRLP